MKKYWKAIGITVIAVGALYYPAMKLYEYIIKKREDINNKETETGEHNIKAFSSAFGHKHKMRHRHSENGHVSANPA